MLMVNLSRLRDRESVLRIFTESLQVLFPPAVFQYMEEKSESSGTSLEIRLHSSQFGHLQVSPPGALDANAGRLVSNAVQMLALILDHLDFDEKLRNERDSYEKIADERLQKLTETVKHLEQARLASMKLVEELTSEVERRTRAEEKLKAGNDLLDATQQIAHIGGWEWDTVRKVMTWTDETYRIHGLKPGEIESGSPAHIERSIACYAPGGQPIIEEAFRRCAGGGEPYDLEFPFTTADGQSRHIRTMARPVFKDGRVIRVIGTIIDITERKQWEEALRLQVEEKEILLRETHHRIKNNIASIHGLLTLQARSAASPGTVSALKEAIGRVGSMRSLYEKILIDGDCREVAVHTYLGALTDSVVALFSGVQEILVEKNFQEFSLSSKILFPLGLIINELLTNAMKYAFTERQSGKVTIGAARLGDRYRFTVQDDGMGLPDGYELDSSKGFGHTLVNMLCRQIGARLSLESSGGTTCVIEF